MARNDTFSIPRDIAQSNTDRALIDRLLCQQAYPASQYIHTSADTVQPADTTYSTMASRGADDGLTAADIIAAYGL